MSADQDARRTDLTATVIRAVLASVNLEAEEAAIAFHEGRCVPASGERMGALEQDARDTRQALAVWIVYGRGPTDYLHKLRQCKAVNAADVKRISALAARIELARRAGAPN